MEVHHRAAIGMHPARGGPARWGAVEGPSYLPPENLHCPHALCSPGIWAVSSGCRENGLSLPVAFQEGVKSVPLWLVARGPC